MRLRLVAHIIVRRGLVFVVVRLLVILPHRVILEAIPHQDASQIRMPTEAEVMKDLQRLLDERLKGGPARDLP